MSAEDEAAKRAAIALSNEQQVRREQELLELTARVFRGADAGDLSAWLTEFADFCQAFSRHEHEGQFLANVCAGRRQAFFWLADHLKLDLPTCYPRYLRQTRGE